MRQIVLDTETTGLEPEQGHRIIEIGCVELVDRRPTGEVFHRYVNPERDIEQGAGEVHGITQEFLEGKPRFVDIANDLLAFLGDAELVIHNAPFDVGFVNHELALAGVQIADIREQCGVRDTLELARQLHPGQRNSLDALCRRYEIDDTDRELHGALLDAQILADVYRAMTGGQIALSLSAEGVQGGVSAGEDVVGAAAVERSGLTLRIVRADDAEHDAHEQRLEAIEAAAGRCLWRELEE